MPKNAISLLKSDHVKVRTLLGRLDRATRAADRTKLLMEIKREVELHTAVEEKIFYPAFHAAERKKDDGKMFYEALAEHQAVKLLLPDLETTPPETEEFAGKAKVLKDMIEHHAEEEEEEMFPRAEALLSEDVLMELGAQMADRKKTGEPAAEPTAPRAATATAPRRR